MCNELALEGIKEPHYNLVAFILKTTVLACVIDEKGIKEGLKKDVKGHKKGIKKDVKGHKKGIKKDVKFEETLIDNILRTIKENPKISYSALAATTGISYKIVRTVMQELIQSHIITRVGPKRGGFWKIEDEKNL
jgi:ATP-dependent DNA helicase RecG